MTSTVIIRGKVHRFRLPPELARAQRKNAGRRMTDEEAVIFVEERRREAALRRARPYLAPRP